MLLLLLLLLLSQAEDFATIYQLQTNTSDTNTVIPRSRERPLDPDVRMVHVQGLYNKGVCGNWGGFENGVPYYKQPHAILGPGHGIPGMRPLINNTWLADAIKLNITKLWPSVLVDPARVFSMAEYTKF